VYFIRHILTLFF